MKGKETQDKISNSTTPGTGENKAATMMVDEIDAVVTMHAKEYSAAMTLEVRCSQSKHTIVHILNDDGKIVKMFGWYLLKGENTTTVEGLDAYNYPYTVTIYDHDGHALFSSKPAW